MTNTRPRGNKAIFWVIIPIVLVAVISGAYIAGNSYVPSRIQLAYRGQDCESVNQWLDAAAVLYPGIATSHPEFKGYVAECKLYINAITQFETKDWENAHDQFMLYEGTYPTGTFIAAVHTNHAVVLFTWANELLAQKQYLGAMAKFNQVITGFSDTEIAEKAKIQSAELLANWGADLRNMQNFPEAEAKFKELDTWASVNSNPEYAARARTETALTYLEVAKLYKSKGEFNSALEQVEKAIQADPAPDSSDSPTSQAHTFLPQLHTAWGDALLAKQNANEALIHYQAAVDASTPENLPAAKDALADAYLKIANDLTAKEDFLAALDQFKLAEANAGTDSLKNSITKDREVIYAVLSQSSGEQAQQAMKNAAKNICEQNIKPELPIFGTDSNQNESLLYGEIVSLPTELSATTPASLHYVVCATEVIEIVETFNANLIYRNRFTHKITSKVPIVLTRDQSIWKFKVFDLATGNIIAQKAFGGPVPMNLGYNESIEVSESGLDRDGNTPSSIHGGKPNLTEVMDWLLSVLKK